METICFHILGIVQLAKFPLSPSHISIALHWKCRIKCRLVPIFKVQRRQK